jgi:exonuclease SbcC
MYSYKLSLKNFKCFSNYSVDIDKEAIILFDGPSGIGKSSLIQAFLFAITGEGKKLFKQGTKSLTVELEKIQKTGENIENKQFKIIRKKGPESLCVYDGDKCYEDDEAQVKINNYFGKNFINTSVIKQKGENSFLSSSSKDKMTFLQSLLFSNSTIEKQKDRVNEMIKVCKDEMNNLSVKKNTLEEVLKNLISRMSKEVISENSSTDKYSKYTDLSVEECDRKIKSRQDKIQYQQKKLQKTINLLQEQQQLKSGYSNDEIKYRQLHSRLSIFEEQRQEVLNKEKEIKEKFSESSYEELLSDISVVRNMIKYIKQQIKCMDTQRVLLEQVSKSLLQIEKEGEKGDENIDESKYNDYCDKRDLLKKKKEVSKKLSECDYDDDEIINKKDIVKELKQFLEKAELYKSSLKCPHCKNSVRLNNSVLEKLETVSDDFTKGKIQEKQKDLKQVEQELEKLEHYKKLHNHYSNEEESINKKLESYNHISIEKVSELSDIINKIEEMKTTRRDLKKRKTVLIEEQKRIRDFSHEQLKQDYILLQKYKNLIEDNKNEKDMSLDKYESKLSELLVLQKEQEKVKDNLDVLNDKKRTFLKEIKSIGVSIETCNEKLSILEDKLEEVDESIVTYEEEISQLRENDKQSEWTNQINILNIQKLNVEYDNDRKRLEKEIESVFERYKQFEKDCVNYNIISEGIEHSESLLLAKFIDTINHNLSIHLDVFFEEPMHVQIKTFKESKSNKEKPVINMEIFYKGNETDLSNLSGGEYDRLNLALTLTFNCISNSPVLILDESLASINQELSTEIIMHLKETISHKLVWMTQHQAVKGMFDKVFQISL